MRDPFSLPHGHGLEVQENTRNRFSQTDEILEMGNWKLEIVCDGLFPTWRRFGIRWLVTASVETQTMFELITRKLKKWQVRLEIVQAAVAKKKKRKTTMSR